MLRLFIQRFCLNQLLQTDVRNQGWTLIEIGAITVIVGILAAMSYPSMAGMQARNDLRAGMEKIKSALAEGQKMSIKKGQKCTVTFVHTDTDGEINISGTFADGTSCISSPVSLDQRPGRDMDLTWGSTLNGGIVFSFKGNTTQSGTLVLSRDNASEMRCLAIANGLGIFRTGIYTGDPASPTAANCNKSL